MSPFVFYANRQSGHMRQKFPVWKGCLHVIGIIIVVSYARFALFDVVQYLLGNVPSEGMLLGVLVLTLATGCLPLIVKCYPQSQVARKLVGILVLAGILLLMLKPPAPIQGGSQCPDWLPFGLCPRLWDERHVPQRESDDIELYGAGYAQREKWTMWLLVSGILCLVFGASSKSPRYQSVEVGLAKHGIVTFFGGALVGLFVALEYLYGPLLLQAVVVAAMIFCMEFVVLVGKIDEGNKLVPLLFGWFMLFPMAMLIHAEFPLAPLSLEAQQAYPDRHFLKGRIQDERYHAAKLALLVSFAAQGMLISLCLKMKISYGSRHKLPMPRNNGSQQGNQQQYNPSKLQTDFFGMCIPSSSALQIGRLLKSKGTPGQNLRQLQNQGLLWVPFCGNLVTLFTFCLQIVVSQIVAPNSQVVTPFLLAPVLLLLHQDPIVCKGLIEQRRYFPLVLSVVFCLSMTSLFQLFDSREQNVNIKWFVIKNGTLQLFALPQLIVFLIFLWDRQKRSVWIFLFLGPLSLVAVLFGEIISVRVLGSAAIMACVCQYLMQNQSRRMGMKMI
eukprot:TRINITY_DN10858_c1_g2_i1.p1 TRINITY_DN10858_c1_g2~~TRINITY_DN10858_c1_g2_i1.p1  ORF type:complete len:556 (-),score=45.39 TRINITY_DN10858_c1_g2_i1:41-1708(-)